MKLISLFLLFFCLCVSLVSDKKTSIDGKSASVLVNHNTNIDTIFCSSINRKSLNDLPLQRFDDFELTENYTYINKDTLFLLSHNDFLSFPFGKFDSIDEFFTAYPNWNLEKEKKIYQTTYYFLSDGKSRATLVDYGNTDNPYHLKKLEVISVSLYDDSAVLQNNIRVGVPKKDLLSCFLDISQITNIESINVLKIDGSFDGSCWMYYDFADDLLSSIMIQSGYGFYYNYLFEIYSLGFDTIGDEELYFGEDSSLRKFTDFRLLDQYTRFNDGVLSVVTAHPFVIYPFGRFSNFKEFLQRYPSLELKGTYLDLDYYHYYVLTSYESEYHLVLSEGEDLKLVEVSIRDKDIILANNIHVGVSKKELLNCLMDINQIDNWKNIHELEVFSAVDSTLMSFYFEDDFLRCIAIWGAYEVSQELFNKLTGSYE